MSVVYRAIWEDDRKGFFAVARAEFQAWVGSKGIDIAIPEQGRIEHDLGTLRCVHATTEQASAIRFRLEEEKPEAYWATTLTAIEDGSQRWGWVDLEWTANNVYSKPPDWAPPRLLRSLLRGGHARVGDLALTDSIWTVTSDDVPRLTNLVFDPERRLPIAAFTMAVGEDFELVRDRAERAAQRLAGVALVAFVTGPAVNVLNEQLGSSLEVFGGAVRVYLPGINPQSPNGFRHRYIKRSQVSRHPDASANILARLLFRPAASARPPKVFRTALRGAFSSGDASDLEQLIEIQDRELEDLNEQLRDAEENLVMATAEQEAAQGESDALARRVRYLKSQLTALGSHVAHAPTPPEAVPDSVDALSDIPDLAAEHLQHVVVLPDACSDLAKLDESIRATVWASKTWRSLRALNEYARLKSTSDLKGDFKHVNRRGELGGFEVSDHWVAMRESETTENHPDYRAARTFPVPETIDAEGRVYMGAHVKLQEGGRPCPRIHFFDDTAGSGLVFVGWIGDHLENKQTN